ncbi:hypothetical protein LUZ60_012992 [Juncus effusus]|nr:hypothetical protein LUZ60_012992 [Juncus effusus]
MMREMQLSSGSRSRSRERGSTHIKKQMPLSFDLPTDYYSMSPELSRNSSKRSNSGKPIKSLIEEELNLLTTTNKEKKKTRQPSPGVVARLMGLDSLPSLPPSNPNPNSHASSSHEKYIFTEDELPEFKDVFEITEARKLKKKLHHKSPVHGRPPSKLVHGGPGSPDMEFVRTKFTEAKRLSTDGSLRSSREFNDAIEALESKKNILLEFLNKPNSLFAKHLRDLTFSPPASPPRGASQITILKPSKIGANSEFPKLEKREIERDRERDSHYNRKYVSNNNDISNSSRSFEDDFVSLTFEKPIKSSKSKGTRGERNKASNIVVLKPSLDKARNTVGVGVFPVIYPENNESQVGPTREKSSREIAREISKQMRRSINANSTSNIKSAPSFEPNPLFDSNYDNNSINSNNDSSLYDEWNYYTVENPVNKEARKRLSDRWRNTRNSDELGPLVNGSNNTLGEIISKEKSHNNSNNVNNSRNLTRSKSLPPKLGHHKSSYSKRRGSRVSEFGLIKDVLDFGPKGVNVISQERSEKVGEAETEREIHVNSEELRKTEDVGPTHVELNCESENVIPFEEMAIEQRDDVAVPKSDDVAHDDVAVPVPKRDVVADRQVEVMESPVGEKEQPSPNSVMEPPFEEIEQEEELEEEASTSECFEKISADLQELRMQLKLLKMGSTTETLNNEEKQNDVFLLSDEESGERVNGQHFRDEEERDFSYLLDMLLDLGFQILNREDLIQYCHSLDSPVGPAVFAKLEMKYGELVLWSRSERKMLFDLINSVLSEIVGNCWADLKKGIFCGYKEEEFVESVWGKVVNKRREIEFVNDEIYLEPNWSKEGLAKSGVDLVGREIESVLYEDLLDEMICELVCF